MDQSRKDELKSLLAAIQDVKWNGIFAEPCYCGTRDVLQRIRKHAEDDLRAEAINVRITNVSGKRVTREEADQFRDLLITIKADELEKKDGYVKDMTVAIDWANANMDTIGPDYFMLRRLGIQRPLGKALQRNELPAGAELRGIREVS